jgi:hypothetical protein
MIVNKIDEMIQNLESIREDAVKFEEKGNSAAATRVNKMMLVIKETASNVRKGISEKRREMKEGK